MKLWTKELEQKAKRYPLYSQDGKGENAEVLVKYFAPAGSYTLLVTEAEQQEDGDWLFFGLTYLYEWEWGYTLLSELEGVRVNVLGYKLPLERDLYSVKEHTTVKDLM